MSLKEKFQITLPGKVNDGEGWTSFESVRNTKNEYPYQNHTSTQETDGKFNELPPGMDTTNQFGGTNEEMGYSLSGDTADESSFTPATAFKKGYFQKPMRGTDDQYTGEHIDLFYGEAYGDDGEVGFVERNNYLDRE